MSHSFPSKICIDKEANIYYLRWLAFKMERGLCGIRLHHYCPGYLLRKPHWTSHWNSLCGPWMHETTEALLFLVLFQGHVTMAAQWPFSGHLLRTHLDTKTTRSALHLDCTFCTTGPWSSNSTTTLDLSLQYLHCTLLNAIICILILVIYDPWTSEHSTNRSNLFNFKALLFLLNTTASYSSWSMVPRHTTTSP